MIGFTANPIQTRSFPEKSSNNPNKEIMNVCFGDMLTRRNPLKCGTKTLLWMLIYYHSFDSFVGGQTEEPRDADQLKPHAEWEKVYQIEKKGDYCSCPADSHVLSHGLCLALTKIHRHNVNKTSDIFIMIVSDSSDAGGNEQACESSCECTRDHVYYFSQTRKGQREK